MSSLELFPPQKLTNCRSIPMRGSAESCQGLPLVIRSCACLLGSGSLGEKGVLATTYVTFLSRTWAGLSSRTHSVPRPMPGAKVFTRARRSSRRPCRCQTRVAVRSFKGSKKCHPSAAGGKSAERGRDRSTSTRPVQDVTGVLATVFPTVVKIAVNALGLVSRNPPSTFRDPLVVLSNLRTSTATKPMLVILKKFETTISRNKEQGAVSCDL